MVAVLVGHQDFLRLVTSRSIGLGLSVQQGLYLGGCVPCVSTATPCGSNCESEVKVKVTQSCLTLCNPMDCIVHGVLQARILEWVAFPLSRGSSQPRD